MQTSRLITGGCSCTQYCWPTWADYLGKHYQEYINTGLCGADNAVIARNIMLVAKPGDTVVVLWTTFDRFNNFSKTAQQETKTYGDVLVQKWSGMEGSTLKGGWQHFGERCGSKEFLVNHYHPIERFRHTLDYVKMVEMHSQLNNYRVFNFSMAEWFLGGSERHIDVRLVNMHNQCNFSHFYLKENIRHLREKIAPIFVKHKYNTTGDSHPTPLVQWNWVNEHVAPEIGINLNQDLIDQVRIDQERVINGNV